MNNFSYIHSYLNYANIAWASIYQTKLKLFTITKNSQRELFLIKKNLYTPGHICDQSML